MKAIVITPRAADSARLDRVPEPAMTNDEVLVRMIRAGICGTDSEMNSGAYGQAPPGSDYLIMGHENFGQVERVGARTSRLHKGDYVVATVRRGCGCLNCRAGESDMCLDEKFTERGILREHGFLAEYYADTEEYLVTVPPQLQEVAVLLEPYSIIAKAMLQTWKIQERLVWQPQTALVLGAGTIGMLAALALRARGLNVVICARSKPGTLNSMLARDMGVTYVSLQETPLSEIPKRMGGRVDIVFEATGHAPTAMECFRLVTANGVVVLNSVTSNQHAVTLDADALNFHLVMNNIIALGIVSANRKYFEQGVLDFAAYNERFPGVLERFITRRVALQDFAVDLLRQRSGVKTTIEIHPD